MELNDNTFAFVPTAGGVVRAGMPDARVCFKLGKVPSSQQQTMEWCQLNVKRLVLGFLSGLRHLRRQQVGVGVSGRCRDSDGWSIIIT